MSTGFRKASEWHRFAIELARAVGVAVNEIGHPYWIEVLPRRFWSRGCKKIRPIPPNYGHFDLDDPVADWKVCDDCGYLLRDPYNWDTQEGWRNSDPVHRLRCSKCKTESGHNYGEQKKAEQHTPDGDLEPIRCNCGLSLPECLVAKKELWSGGPPCPAWDIPGDRSVHSDLYFVPSTMWTFRLLLPPKPALKTAARWQGKKKQRMQGDLFGRHLQ